MPLCLVCSGCGNEASNYDIPVHIKNGAMLEGQKLTANKETDYDRVIALYNFFTADNKFRYDLQTEGGTSGQDIVNFLENRKGFCQQYAAALTWMVRQAGIPAPVAFVVRSSVASWMTTATPSPDR